MARRSELAVGQVRELRHPSTGRYANKGVAKCRILGLDRPAEIYARGNDNHSPGYREHKDLVLVEVLEEHGWTWYNSSSLQTRERPVRKHEPYRGGYGSRRWESERLPKDQYLVKPKLLGPIWDEEEKAEIAQAEAIAKERRRLHAEAVQEQDQRLSKILEEAGVSTSKWTGGHQWRLSSNDLARIIEDVSHGTVTPGLVHWKDYQDLEVKV